jgi:predicted nucleotidyltransferase
LAAVLPAVAEPVAVGEKYKEESEMAHWSIEKLTESLQRILGDKLISVILYGSAAAGDHAGKKSDMNVLVVSLGLKPRELLTLSQSVIPWVKSGNPIPLFLTKEHLKNYVEVFPIEILDMQSAHQVLIGEDLLGKLKVSKTRLKVELEHELEGKLLQLKSRYILTEGKKDRVWHLMVESLATFLVLFKNCIWLTGKKPPLKKMEALRLLGKRFKVNVEAFETVDRVKRGENLKNLDPLKIFEGYLDAIETLMEQIGRAHF